MIVASLFLAVGVGFGVHAMGTETASAAPVAPTRAATVAVPASLTLTDLGAADECGGAVTQDAASCFDGGWSYAGCCAGTIPHSKFTKGSQTKCCGACMMF